MLRISWTELKTNTWIQEKIGIPEEKGILEQIKHRKLSKYCHWKIRSNSVVLATIEDEIEGTYFPGRRRTAWIDNVRRWTSDDMNVARTNAMERRCDCWQQDVCGSFGLRHTNNNSGSGRVFRGT